MISYFIIYHVSYYNYTAHLLYYTGENYVCVSSDVILQCLHEQKCGKVSEMDS